MMDQAEKLRKIINTSKIKNISDTLKPSISIDEDNSIIETSSKNAKVITITSGKGGVGKTNIAVNLGLSLIAQGQRVVILDADFGLANIEVVMGAVPKYNLLDVLKNKKNLLEVISQGPNNIRFISGGSGVEELARLTKENLQSFIRNISILDRLFDVIIVDTGAGVSENVISLVLAADEVLLVTTPEPTSLTDAYALIKMICARDSKKIINILVNCAQNQAEATQIFSKLNDVTTKFIGAKIESLGYVSCDEAVKKAVNIQKPFVLSFPKSIVSKQVMELSKRIISSKSKNDITKRTGAKGFIKKFVKFMEN